MPRTGSAGQTIQEVGLVGVDSGATARQIIVDTTGRIIVGGSPDLSPASAELTASAAGAATALTATLAAAANERTYISGFQITGAGATAASIISVTVTGTIVGTLDYRLVIPAGATTSITPLIIPFSRPIPASALNTAIVVNVPSFGAGNTAAAVVAHGFRLA